MKLTVAERIAHLTHAAAHLITYGQVEAAKVIQEIIGEIKGQQDSPAAASAGLDHGR